jgi:hypothetical protein
MALQIASIPCPGIVMLEERTAPKLTRSLVRSRPIDRVIVNLDGAGSPETTGRFGAMTVRGGVVEIIVARHVSATSVTIDRTTRPQSRLAESISFYKEKSIASKMTVISPRSIAMTIASPSIMIDLK